MIAKKKSTKKTNKRSNVRVLTIHIWIVIITIYYFYNIPTAFSICKRLHLPET